MPENFPSKEHDTKPLVEKFRCIRNSHETSTIKTIARVALGPSVMRVYTKNTTANLLKVLSSINANELRAIQNQTEFAAWFDALVSTIHRCIRKTNEGNKKIRPGAKWGHSSKIAAIFVRNLVLNSRYFSDRDARRLSGFLYVPIDSIVIKELKKLKQPLNFSRIREIDTRRKFYNIQNVLGAAARQARTPRVWFDDIWADR
ncbi:MAG: hypothetical protein ACYC1L_08425 [Alphaproteobacteria bacterium]